MISPSRNGLVRHATARLRRLAIAVPILALAAGCGTIRPNAAAQPAYYSLDSAMIEPRGDATLPPPLPSTTLTLIVNPPHAASGFDSQRIIYARNAHQLEYFAHSEWVDTPARMLAPLIVNAMQRGGAFHAVVLTPSAAAGDLRLDSQIVRLLHEFDGKTGGKPGGQPDSQIGAPSRVRFTLRAYLVDNSTRRVLAWREFDVTEPSASEDPLGGVIAANRAVRRVLQQLAAFAAESARQRN
jgi:cholesterol transport system auxiliary component